MKSLILLFCLCSLASIVAGQVDISAIQRCANLAIGSGCTNTPSPFHSATSVRLNLAVACNNSEFAVEASTACAKDSSSGLYCGAAGTTYIINVTLANDACVNSMVPTNNCTDECKNHLTTLRRELGCCINSVFNTSQTRRFDQIEVFRYPLWSKCGVTTVIGGCPGRLSFNLHDANRTCNYSEVQTADLRSTCTSAIIDEIRNVLRQHNYCNSYLDFITSVCSVDSKGTFCLATDRQGSDFTNYIVPLYTNGCTDRTSSSCSRTCRDLLQGFADNRGCCINALYNSTLGFTTRINQTFLGTTEIFTRCGVQPPPVTCMSGVRTVTATGGGCITSLGNIAVILLLLFVVGLLIG